MKQLITVGLASVALAACSGATDTPPSGKGGSVQGGAGGRGGSATGGTTATGGVVTTGGSRASGGAVTGGSTASGGQPATGGQSAIGGASGGTSSTGGRASGGTTGAGGVASGGTLAAGAGGTTGGTGGRGGAGGGAGGGSTTPDAGATGGTGGSTIIAATPPMGWNSWNKFGCDGLNESVVKRMADAFVTSGMKDAGYQYVNLDDCWMNGRDSSGTLQWDKTRFASGIPALADYIHGKGLKIGIYETPSATTCAGKTGGAGHESQDAKTFAQWGIDYLKYDHCRTSDLQAFTRMGEALKATGRPIVYSINPVYGAGSCIAPSVCITACPCNVDCPKIAHLWRIGFDINASWNSVIGLIDINTQLALHKYAGPGHWNDPDMLEVGNGLSDTDGRAHFSMWAILAAPLITGNDLSNMSETTKAILTNKEIIAVDQDPLGYQGRVVATPGANLQVWSKNLTGTNTRAVALFNRGTGNASITVKWSDIGLPAGSATVRDLWAAKDLGPFTDSYTGTNIAGHTVMMLKIVSGS